jgi:Zn-dependent peptidase ImmA (M78 family)/transcriptional regulator with XRE-family HTH domain
MERSGMDLSLLGDKLKRYREQFQCTHADVQRATGIAEDRLRAFEAGQNTPTGDEILILADYYKCDYKFFVSNEKLASFEQTDTLFRLHGAELSKEDRWAIQEFLFLCECEEFLEQVVPRVSRKTFSFHPTGTYYKGHAEECAKQLREHLGYGPMEVGANVYDDIRKIGMHVFRRKLANSNISGLFVLHPVAGRCILVNYEEDVYRQRFTAMHEAGHAIFDTVEQVVVSYAQTKKGDLAEIRANKFAACMLLPPSLLAAIPDNSRWDESRAADFAAKFKVSTAALAVGLKEANLIDYQTYTLIQSARVPREAKQDPELPNSLSPNGKQRKLALLHRGLSDFFVGLCFDAYDQGEISSGRLTEMLLLASANELADIAGFYGRSLRHGD